MDNQKLRAVLFEIQDNLSKEDRMDLSFNGTLLLIESLFDQDQINERELTLLINAFESIQCYHAANLLKDYQSRENVALPKLLKMEYDQLCEHTSDVKLTTSGSNSLTKFQFVVLDLSTRLDPASLAMLKSLNAMIGESMFIVDDNSAINFDLLPQQGNFLFTSSQFAATMKDKHEIN